LVCSVLSEGGDFGDLYQIGREMELESQGQNRDADVLLDITIRLYEAHVWENNPEEVL